MSIYSSVKRPQEWRAIAKLISSSEYRVTKQDCSKPVAGSRKVYRGARQNVIARWELGKEPCAPERRDNDSRVRSSHGCGSWTHSFEEFRNYLYRRRRYPWRPTILCVPKRNPTVGWYLYMAREPGRAGTISALVLITKMVMPTIWLGLSTRNGSAVR